MSVAGSKGTPPLVPPHRDSRGVDADACEQGLESADQEDYQVFPLDFVADDVVPSLIMIVMQGTVDGGDSFFLTDASFLGTPIDNPTDVLHVSPGSQRTRTGVLYPPASLGRAPSRAWVVLEEDFVGGVLLRPPACVRSMMQPLIGVLAERVVRGFCWSGPGIKNIVSRPH